MSNQQYARTIEPICFDGRTFCIMHPDVVIRERIGSYVLEHGGMLDPQKPDYRIGEGNLTPVQFWIGAGEYDRLQKTERLEEAMIFLSSDTPFSDRERGQILWYIRENREQVIGKILDENLSDALGGYLAHYHETLPGDYVNILQPGQYREQIQLDLVDELITRAAARQKHELKAWLLEYKKNRFPESFLEQTQQEQLDKELGFLEQNEYDWLKLFSFAYEEDGVHISDYKGEDPMVFAPDEIGGRPVTSIAVRNFFACDQSLQFAWQRPAHLRPRIDREKLALAAAGEEILFGRYPYEKSGETREIQWRVLKKEGSRLLVISKYCLDKIPYHQDLVSIDWENCGLRRWFNGPFYQLAFTGEEQAMIPAVTLVNEPNPKYHTSGGRDTVDRIFALSLREAEALFESDEARLGYTTLYAQSRGFYFGGKFNCWWLRGPGVSPEFAALVGNSGSLGNYGYRVDQNEYAVRPAMWIDIGG